MLILLTLALGFLLFLVLAVVSFESLREGETRAGVRALLLSPTLTARFP